MTYSASRIRSMTGCAIALLSGLIPGLANTSPVCRWKDSDGHTYIADVVPDAYTAVATCTESQNDPVSPEQRRAALQRAAQDRAHAQALAASRAGSAASAAAARIAAPSTDNHPVVKRPAEVVTEATDCATWWRLFDESSACFGPFRTVHGAIRTGAFDVCNVIASPEPKCGLRIN